MTPDAAHRNNEAEWTVVKTRGKGPRSRRQLQRTADSSITQRGPCANSRSAFDIGVEYREIRRQWEGTASCSALRQIIKTNKTHSPLSVSRAICLGIGSFDPPDGAWEAKRRTFVQFTAFLVMIEELERNSAARISCIFQEPLFTHADKEFITGLGHRVVESPVGCEMTDTDSIIFGIHLYRPIYALTLKVDCPAIFVGTGWEVWDQVSLSEPIDDLDNMQKMENTFKKDAFPQDTSSTAFSSTCIYWRQPTP